MSIQRHGLSIGIERINDAVFLSIKAWGKLTHEDYETITPVIDNALNGITDPHVIALCDIREFEGWEMRAAWDDFRLGLKHGSEFKKVAILGSGKLHKLMSAIGNWFISGDMEFFEDDDEALEWLEN